MILSIIFIVLICLLDQLSKLWAVQDLMGQASIPVIDGVLNFTYVENKGAAFGMMAEHRWIFMIISSIAIIAIFVYLCTLNGKKTMLRVALTMIVGGGIGNMFDRIILGYVVDFIDFRMFDFWTWVFNIADCAVCVGAGLLIIAMIIEFKKESKKA